MSLPRDHIVPKKKGDSIMYSLNRYSARMKNDYVVVFGLLFLLSKCRYDEQNKCYYWYPAWLLLQNFRFRFYFFYVLSIICVVFFFYLLFFSSVFAGDVSTELSKYLNSDLVNDACIPDTVEKTLKNLPIIEFSREFLYGNTHFVYLTNEDVKNGYTTVYLKQSNFQGETKVALQTLMDQALLNLEKRNIDNLCVCFSHLGVRISGGILKRKGLEDFVFMNASWNSYSSSSILQVYSEEERRYFKVPKYGEINYLTSGNCNMVKNLRIERDHSACVVICGGIF